MNLSQENADEYPPKEDTYFLLDLIEPLKGKRVLEIGCSKGFLLDHFSTGREGLFVGIDISLKSPTTGKPSKLEFVKANGEFLPFRNDCFDLIFFNPPYLPSDSIEDKTVDGGKEGIEVTIKFLKSSKKALKSSGLVTFITSSLSNLDELEKVISELGFKIIKKTRKPLFFEELIGYYLKHKFQ